MQTLIDEDILTQLNKLMLASNQSADKVDFLQEKMKTIEKHLPMMIQEILEYYFDKKVIEHSENLVTKDVFKKALSTKLDNGIFQSFERRLAGDRSSDEKQF
jgi:siderophore synthetase component